MEAPVPAREAGRSRLDGAMGHRAHFAQGGPDERLIARGPRAPVVGGIWVHIGLDDQAQRAFQQLKMQLGGLRLEAGEHLAVCVDRQRPREAHVH